MYEPRYKVRVVGMYVYLKDRSNFCTISYCAPSHCLTPTLFCNNTSPSHLHFSLIFFLPSILAYIIYWTVLIRNSDQSLMHNWLPHLSSSSKKKKFAGGWENEWVELSDNWVIGICYDQLPPTIHFKANMEVFGGSLVIFAYSYLKHILRTVLHSLYGINSVWYIANAMSKWDWISPKFVLEWDNKW